MLVDIEFKLQEHLDHARAFFAEPTPENGNTALPKESIEVHFGFETIAPGMYYVGSPNTSNFLREITDPEKSYRTEWCEHRSYGTADSLDQILAYARPAEIDQACVLLIVPLDEIPEKSGPYIGTLDEDERPAPKGAVLDWGLVAIDPAKLEAALEKRASAGPAP